MGKVIGIINHKGGCAKTTTAINLAGLLADWPNEKKQNRVLIVDLDPQRSAIECVSDGSAPANGTLDERLVATPAGRIPIEPCIMPSRWERIDYIPTDTDRMTEANLVMPTRHLSPVTVLSTLLKPIIPSYDYIIIDTGPAQGILMWDAIYASQFGIIPTQLDEVNLREINRTIANIRRLADEFGRAPRLLGILPTVFRKGVRAQEEYLEVLRKKYTFTKVFDPVPVSTDVQEAYSAKQPLHRYNSKVPATEAYVKLALEVQRA